MKLTMILEERIYHEMEIEAESIESAWDRMPLDISDAKNIGHFISIHDVLEHDND